MLTRGKIAIVAVHSVIGDAIVNGCGASTVYVAQAVLGGPAKLLEATEARNVASAVQVVQFDGCRVDSLPVARDVAIVVRHRGRRILELGEEQRVDHARPAVAHSGR